MLEDISVPNTVVDAAEDAAARLLLGDKDRIPCVLVDVGDVARGEAALTQVDARLRTLREMVPWATPVLVARAPWVNLVLAGMRAVPPFAASRPVRRHGIVFWYSVCRIEILLMPVPQMMRHELDQKRLGCGPGQG